MADITEQVTEQKEKIGNQNVVTREVSHESRDEHINRGERIVWYLIGIIVVFLSIRVVLALIGANLQNQFASFIYTITEPFVFAFRGLLQSGDFHAGVSRLETETIVAILVYLLVGWGITSAMKLLSKKPMTPTM